MKPVLAACALLSLLMSPVLASADPSAPRPNNPDPVTVDLGTQTVTLWPFTSEDFSTASDPINLVFPNADPRQVRQALMALDGDRSSLGFPFNIFDCTWSDAEGYEQAAWGGTEGWTGGDVQLACGSFAMRFHVRLFRQGAVTLGAAHMDIQITGTAQHEPVAWEFPELFVTLDLIRSGGLKSDPRPVFLFDTGGYFKTIRTPVYNGLPEWLRQVLGLTDSRVPNDGIMTAFDLDVVFDPVQYQRHEEWTIVYNQFIPKPFCAQGPWDLVRVEGPLQFALDVHTNPSGYYSRASVVAGILDVTPFDARTGTFGTTVQAIISIDKRGMLTDNYSETSQVELQNLLGQPLQSSARILNAGHSDRYTLTIDCGSANP